MKRALNALILLYPKKWRKRYESEFHALLADVSPGWRTFFDVFAGAMKMQLKTWSAWKTVAACEVVGLLAAVGFAGRVPDRYVSTAVIRLNGNFDGTMQSRLRAETDRILSRSNLTQLIAEEGLYKGDRAPIEEILARMQRQDIRLDRVMPLKDPQGVPVGFSVSFAAPDAGQAQRTTERLATAFVNSNVGFLLEAANLPVHPENPERTRIVLMGLAAGMLTGAAVALFLKLRVWKLAVALGVGGAVLGGVLSLLLPERFMSTAVIFCSRADRGSAAAEAARLDELIAAIESKVSLGASAAEFKLDPADVRKHLNIQHGGSIEYGTAVTVRFESGGRKLAQEVVRSVTGRLMDEFVRPRVNALTLGRETLELLDPASLPDRPMFPNRPMVTGMGVFVGLGCAVLWGGLSKLFSSKASAEAEARS
jgi:hypothetical protein